MTEFPLRLSQMRLRDLRLLDLVERHGTLGQIALQLHLTQPAVTQALQTLEQAFATPLVLREARGVKLTPAGTAALTHLRAMAHEARLAWEAASRPQRPVIKLGCSPMASLTVVPRGLARMRSAAPEIEVQLEEANVPTLWGMLAAGAIDALVARRPDLAAGERVPDGAVVERVGQERMVIAAPQALVLARQRGLLALAHNHWVLPPPGSVVARTFRAWFASRGLAVPSIDYTSTSFMMNLQIASQCGLVTIAPESAVRPQLAALSLKIVEVQWEGGLSEIVLAWRSSRVDDPLLGKLRACLALPADGFQSG